MEEEREDMSGGRGRGESVCERMWEVRGEWGGGGEEGRRVREERG
jgi:hypothetical protein